MLRILTSNRISELPDTAGAKTLFSPTPIFQILSAQPFARSMKQHMTNASPADRSEALRIAELKKSYGSTHVLDIPAFRLGGGEQVALSGASGSGKTTLLNVIAGIAAATSGAIVVDGEDLMRMGEAGRDRFRARHIGYIFQTFNLLPAFSALENVLLGMTFAGATSGSPKERAAALLDRVGLAHRRTHRPRELSVGEQQRVAVARALANRPALVLADEPTANLDLRTGRAVVELIRQVCADEGSALLLVTHDSDVMAQFDHVRPFAEINRASREEEAAA
jgi:putative ABC transport system ATP-binding protein